MEEIFIGRTLTKQEIQKGLRPHRNIIVNRKHISMLNIWEQRVFFYCLGFFEEHSKTEKLSFTFQQLMGQQKLDGRSYEKLKAAVNSLLDITIMLKNTRENRYKKYNVFSHIEVIENTGVVEFEFVHNKGGIGELKTRKLREEGYTSLDFSVLVKLQKPFSYQIYALLKQGGDEYRQRDFSIEDLKNKLGIAGMREFNTYDKFKNKVLIQACKDINAHTDISVEWKVFKKSGRRITHIIFHWRHDNPNNDLNYHNNKLKSGQLGLDFNLDTVHTFEPKEEAFIQEEIRPSESKIVVEQENTRKVVYNTYEQRELRDHFFRSYLSALELLKKEINTSAFLSDEDKEIEFHAQGEMLYKEVLKEQNRLTNFNPLKNILKQEEKIETPSLIEEPSSYVKEERALKITDFSDFQSYYSFCSESFISVLEKYYNLLYPKFNGIFESYIIENTAKLDEYAETEEEATGVITQAVQGFKKDQGRLYPYQAQSVFPQTVGALVQKVNETGHSEKVKAWVMGLSAQEFETLLTFKEMIPGGKGVFVQCQEFPTMNLRVALNQAINLRKKNRG